MRPTVFRQEWSARDQALAVALVAHEASIGRCGKSHAGTTDPDLDGWFEVDTEQVCYACAALERHEREQQEPGEPGQLVRIVDLRTITDDD